MKLKTSITKLEHQYYAGTVIRSLNAGEVTPEEADAISLSPLDGEAQADYFYRWYSTENVLLIFTAL